jgi:hypothetical protein
MDYIEITVYDVALRYFYPERIEKISCGKWKAMKQTNDNGYKTITIKKRKIIKVHRVVYYAHNQDWNIENSTTDNSIDHLNGIRNDNCITNLRTATHKQNQQNRVGARGCSFNKHAQKWSAQIGVNGKVINLGYYETEELAHQAYLIAKPNYHTRE